MNGKTPRLEFADYIAGIESQLGNNITVVKQLAGGWNNGALLVRIDGMAQVLKFHGQRNFDELEAIQQLCEFGIEKGWQTPKWVAVGVVSNNLVWSLQEFVEGTNPHILTEADASAIIRANERQAGLAKHFPFSANISIGRPFPSELSKE